jgi:uncharacterized lipoprotein YddW (UPF0748 family)
VWVPTVLSLNYPSQKTTDPARLQSDATDILDRAKDLGFNAVFLQVRPAADSFYKSDIFPWSKYLTGMQGLEPDGGFDPLAFFIQGARARGMQLHAWVNPYRVTAEADDFASLSATHPARLHPEWTVAHTDGKIYWNPGVPEAQKLIIDGVKEILSRYDVDGVHIDDYFYPSRDFDDGAAYAAYGAGKTLDEWRYANTESMVRGLYEAVHASGKAVVFGVSPMGIWANKSSDPRGSDTKGGEGYIQRYADALGWVKKGVVDYIAPQIYWNIGYEIAEYKTLVDWWSEVTAGTGVKLYIGQAAYRAGNAAADSPWHGAGEIGRQVEFNRSKAAVSGYIMYSFGSFTGNAELYELMRGLNQGGAAQGADDAQSAEGSETAPPPETPRFSDLEGHWAAADIGAMAGLGFVKGYPEGDFKPDAPIKRADFVLMMMNMLPYDASGKDAAPFLDMAPDAYYLEAVRDARRMGIVTGAGDDMFFPEDEITRQDMMTIAYRAFTVTGRLTATADAQTLDGFKDKGDVAVYAAAAIAALVGGGYVNGIDGELAPGKGATRAETAVLLLRFYRSLLG